MRQGGKKGARAGVNSTEREKEVRMKEEKCLKEDDKKVREKDGGSS